MSRHHRFSLVIALCLVVVAAWPLGEAAGQGTNASITGRVVDDEGAPLPGANVLVENTSTGFTTGTATGPEGRFTLRELPLGPYAVTVSFVSYRTQRRTGLELSQGDELALSFTLSQTTTDMEEVVVEASSFQSQSTRLGARTRITAEEVETLPAAGRNFTDLIKLSPRVGSGDNIAGMDGRNNALTIDGVNAKETNFGGSGSSPYVLSMAALREFEVVTNSYDVVEGRGTAGAVKAVSKSGTNEFEGSVFGHFWDKRLAAPTDIRGRDVEGDTKSQRGFTLGGPIIKDKLHFFVAYDGERKDEAYSLWSQSTNPGIMENGIGMRASAENVNRIISILEEKYSLDPDQRQIGFFSRTNQLDTFFGRLDWQVNDRHKLTARYIRDDFVRPKRNNSHIGAIGVHEVTYDFVSEGHNALLSLRSQLASGLTNDLKLGYYYNRRANVSTNGRVPNLWVYFQSDIGGQTEQAVLNGRGYEWVPEDQRSEVLSLINNTYYSTDRLDITVGTETALIEASGLWTHGQQGRFTFNSIEALDNMEPARFTRRVATEGRSLTDPIATRHLETAAYGQVEANLTERLKATAGLRYDLAYFISSPEYNPVLEQELGLRNDTNPIDWDNIQPRLNLTWDVTGDGRNILQGGAGWFQGQTLTRPYAQAFVFNGLRFYEVEAEGGAVPTPDYEAYEEDFANLPGESLAPPEGERQQIVRLLDTNYEMPYAFRANVSYHRYLTDWLRVGANLYYNKVMDLPYVQNPNLHTEAGFRLNGEGGRRVYGPISELRDDPVDGFDDDASRISDRFAEVSMFTSGYEQSSRMLVMETDVQLPNNGLLRASYTYNRSKGAAIYHNEVDHRFVGRSYNDFDFIAEGHSNDDFKHKVLLNFTSPEIRGFQVSGYFNLMQGDRYTAMIDGRTNVSGLPGEHDYPAFVFDPDDPDTPETLAEDMRYVLNHTSNRFREYLERNMGQYATPNGGISPWEPELDLRITQSFDMPLGRQIVLNADIFNVLNLLNPDWGGEYNIIDTRLLQVTGFDEGEQRYEYQVNREAGQRRYEGPGFTTRFGIKYIF